MPKNTDENNNEINNSPPTFLSLQQLRAELEKKGMKAPKPITGGVHASKNKQGIGGKYPHSKYGAIFVKQDEYQVKNLVEWVFYHCTNAALNAVGLDSIAKRMSPICLVAKKPRDNRLNEIFVGSIAHKDMKDAWEVAYPKIKPGKKEIPKKRPGGFEHFNQAGINQFVEDFSRDEDPEGFAMLAVLRPFGHYATHLGNLGVQSYSQEIAEDGHRNKRAEQKSKLVIFDYGAAALYDLGRTQFDEPTIRGSNIDKLLAKAGASKDYATYYKPAIYSSAAEGKLDTLQGNFGKVSTTIQKRFIEIFKELSQRIDFNALMHLARNMKLPEDKIKGCIKVNQSSQANAERLANVLAKQYFENIQNRINYIPKYIQENRVNFDNYQNKKASLTPVKSKKLSFTNQFLSLFNKRPSVATTTQRPSISTIESENDALNPSKNRSSISRTPSSTHRTSLSQGEEETSNRKSISSKKLK